MAIPAHVLFPVVHLSPERILADASQPIEELLAVVDVRPGLLSKIEHLLELAGIGERVTRLGRRHGSSVALV